MSGIRISPPNEFLIKIASIFVSDIDLSHITEIYLQHTSQEHVCNEFMALHPELEIYYYPSKLKSLRNKNDEYPFNSCVNIFKQLLRKNGYNVSVKHKLLIIRPPYL